MGEHPAAHGREFQSLLNQGFDRDVLRFDRYSRWWHCEPKFQSLLNQGFDRDGVMMHPEDTTSLSVSIPS